MAARDTRIRRLSAVLAAHNRWHGEHGDSTQKAQKDFDRAKAEQLRKLADRLDGGQR